LHLRVVVLLSQLFVVFGEFLPEVVLESESLKWSLGCHGTICLLRERLCINALFPNEVIGLTWLWEFSKGVAIFSRVERKWLVKWKQKKRGSSLSTPSSFTDLPGFWK
jgi:hypothetical protein